MNKKSSKLQQVNKAIYDYVKILQQDKLPIKEIYLFGFFSKKKAHKDSDIDICIISDKFKNSCLFNMYLNKMAVKLGHKYNNYISPVGFTKKKFNDMVIPLAYEIKTTGKKISI